MDLSHEIECTRIVSRNLHVRKCCNAHSFRGKQTPNALGCLIAWNV
jgi:hypothetical protein